MLSPKGNVYYLRTVQICLPQKDDIDVSVQKWQRLPNLLVARGERVTKTFGHSMATPDAQATKVTFEKVGKIRRMSNLYNFPIPISHHLAHLIDAS